jgi:hypothetical protein
LKLQVLNWNFGKLWGLFVNFELEFEN